MENNFILSDVFCYDDIFIIMDTLTSTKKEQVIWEEKKSTEVEKNCSNNIVTVPSDIMIDINKEYLLSEWPNTIVPVRSGIYKIINKINGKYYVGSANNIRNRWKKHFIDLDRQRHPNYHLQSAWNKYGNKSFVFVFVFIKETDSNRKSLYEIEYKYLKIAFEEKASVYNLKFKPNGGPTDTYGRWKISEYNKTRIFSFETRTKIGNANKIRIISNKTKRKLADAIRNRPIKQSTINKWKKNPQLQKMWDSHKDKSIYQFKNRYTNETFIGTQFEFRTKYNLNRSNISQLIKGSRKSCKDWILIIL